MELFPLYENFESFQLGQAEIWFKKSASILTEAKGFMNTYDYTLNPYSGCSFGCTYCYAAFFARSEDMRKKWGLWVQVKQNALNLLKKFRNKPLRGKTIYMSSVTDPYQPVEKELLLTRSLIQELLTFHQPNLVIQTRSALVTRDIDLLQDFTFLQVNMTINTDNEKVRKVFEPYCPSNEIRLKAIKTINEAGIDSCITVTPLLPLEDADTFAKKLVDSGVKRFIIQPFHPEKGKFIASTRENALNLIKEMNWTNESYLKALDIIRKYIPDIGIGKEGFKPPE